MSSRDSQPSGVRASDAYAEVNFGCFTLAAKFWAIVGVGWHLQQYSCSKLGNNN